MKLFAILILLALSSGAFADDLQANVVSAKMTNFTSKDTFSFLSEHLPLQLKSEQQFSKLEFILQNKIKVDRITVESCGDVFHDGIDFYINYDEDYKFLEGGKAALSYDTRQRDLDVKAIAINFRRNVSFCLKKISLELGGRIYKLHVPQLLAAKISAQDLKLFDSRYDSYILADEKTQKLNVAVEGPRALGLDHVTVWAGNFSNDILFKKYPRPKSLTVKCDRQTPSHFDLIDQMVPQSFQVTSPLNCKKLDLEFSSSYPGYGPESKTFAVTEVQFENKGKTWIPDVTPLESLRQAQMKEQFEKADLPEVLERQLKSVETANSNVLRLHADGSFFLHGFDELAKENESYYILGEMTAEFVKKGRVKITLRGMKRSSTYEMDSLSCGRRCFEIKDFSSDKYFFEQEFLIRKGKDDFYRIDTLTSKSQRRIDFTSIRFLLDHSL